MKAIYKYTLRPTDINFIELPKGAAVLSTEKQGNQVVVYALVNIEEKEKTLYDFRTYATGQQIEENLMAKYRFLGTVSFYDASLIYHVFCKRVGEKEAVSTQEK